jgi:hypothetical protein
MRILLFYFYLLYSKQNELISQPTVCGHKMISEICLYLLAFMHR